jgi:plastocyanin
VRRLAVIATLFAVPVAACGGDDDDASARSVTVPAGAAVGVVADEYFFDPARVIMRGAGPLTIRLRNRGELAHNLKLFRGDEEVGGTPTFPGGRTESGRVNVEHGNYEMVCTVGDHAELGMTGTVRVR